MLIKNASGVYRVKKKPYIHVLLVVCIGLKPYICTASGVYRVKNHT